MKINSILIFSLIGLFMISSCGSKRVTRDIGLAHKGADNSRINNDDTPNQIQNRPLESLTGEQLVERYIQIYSSVAIE